ncbi:hypothetical protein LLH03_19350 [bacterium]|nr:hypothetical protein [bacterium]
MRALTLAVFGLTIVTLAGGDEAVVKHSDVVFMGPKSVDVYKAYGATMVSWGGGAASEAPKDVASFAQRVKDAHDLGIRYCAGLAFRTAFARMIDFDPNFLESVCRNLKGEPITVPWLWDLNHKGHPAYWFCTNAPGYRKYLLYQCKNAMATQVEGLHIDDYNGTAGTESQGGCFCPHCMAAFREYLKSHLSAERLAQLKIGSLDGFDYGAWLTGQGITDDDFRKKVRSGLPLGEEFLTFQYRAAAEWVGEVRKYAEGLAGHPLMLSVNSSASGPGSLVIAPQLSYFCGEVGHDAGTLKVSYSPIFTYKLGDALQRPQVCTGAGQDWALIDERKLPGLVRTWIAQSYAFGHQLMCPHRQWAYTAQKGTHWYQSQPSDYAWMYQFVRSHAALFDGFEAVAPVGVVYSNAAFRKGKTAARNVCLELAQRNIPFRVLIAGDDWLDVRLKPEDLVGLRAIIVTPPMELDAQQQAVLDSAADRIVTWPDEARLQALAPSPITVEGASNVTVVPRAPAGDDSAPMVCHLVNRNYVAETDSCTPQTNLTVTLSRWLTGPRPVTAATLLAPNKEPVRLDVAGVGDATRIPVPELGEWAILRISRGDK